MGIESYQKRRALVSAGGRKRLRPEIRRRCGRIGKTATMPVDHFFDKDAQLILKKNKRGTTVTFALSFLLISAAFHPLSAGAGQLMLGAGIGNDNSHESEAAFAHYLDAVAPLFKYESFYEITLGAWNGPTKNQIIALSRGVYFKPFKKDSDYISLSGGVGAVANETVFLGTHFQFIFRLALGRRFGRYDLSINQYHISNGKNIFGWNGPNVSENYLTLQIGMEL
jgi:hypothetical protein